MSGVPLLEVRDLAFAYGRRQVLSAVNLEVARGELVALLGTNGSGKTTLLRLIAGTLHPAAGSVRFDDRPVGEWRRPALARRVAVLPQRLELPAGFRVAEVVEMGRAPHARRLFGATADDQRAVERALLDADAVDLAHRPVQELSGGERQRVAVAMALAQEPELLLLDEPTVHLDVAHRIGLLSTVARLQRSRGLTVLAVLHDLDLAAAFAPRVAVLSAGRIVADGAPGEVISVELVRTVFGVTMDQATTTDGRHHLVARI
jgi:iron complex transport system ATP-binding protein